MSQNRTAVGEVGADVAAEVAAGVVDVDLPSQRPALDASLLRSATHPLPDGAGRAAAAEALLSDVVSRWGLVVAMRQTWLSTAQEVLSLTGPMDLFVQYDAVMHLVTVELWHDGGTAFGLDDWVGF